MMEYLFNKRLMSWFLNASVQRRKGVLISLGYYVLSILLLYLIDFGPANYHGPEPEHMLFVFVFIIGLIWSFVIFVIALLNVSLG